MLNSQEKRNIGSCTFLSLGDSGEKLREGTHCDIVKVSMEKSTVCESRVFEKTIVYIIASY